MPTPAAAKPSAPGWCQDTYELPKDEAAQIREAKFHQQATALHTTPGAALDCAWMGGMMMYYDVLGYRTITESPLSLAIKIATMVVCLMQHLWVKMDKGRL